MKSLDVTISKPNPDDAEEIIRLYYDSWLATYPNEELGITVEDIKESYKNSFESDFIKKHEKHIAESLDAELRLVAKCDGKIVGAAAIVRSDEGAHLKTMYVQPGFEGKGIGTKMWQELRAFCDPRKKVTVHVATYVKAVQFYKKLGFVDTSKRFTEERYTFKSEAVIPEMELEMLPRI